MARSAWKFSYFSKSMWRKIHYLKHKSWFYNTHVKAKKLKKYTFVRNIFYDRSSTIPKCLKNYWVSIHKGRGVRRIVVNSYSVGHKLGEFGYTRKPFHFPVRKKKGKQVRR